MADTDSSLLRPSLLRTLILVVLATAALVMIDSVLARTEQTETAAEATRFYSEGQRLMQQGNPAAAAESFRAAIANARDNTAYPLALGQALLDAGELDQASSTLTDLLRADPMAGAPNLVMARLLVRQNDITQATSYYHRSIYGQWSGDARASRVSVRFELADLLARRNARAELLAELLPLQDEAPADPATRARLARLYMTAGAPARAAAIFRDLAHASPQDPDAHEGLGDAEFAGGNYALAQTSFLAALRLRPGDAQAQKGLDLANQVLDLDPLRRGLDAPERYRRSLHVLELVTGKAAQCLSPSQTAGPAGDLLNNANAALKRRVPAARQADAVDANLDLANKLWQAERTTCSSAVAPADLPLQLVLAKAAQ